MSVRSTLEAEIGEIRALDELRSQARALEAKGLRGLGETEVPRTGWYNRCDGDRVETALVAKVLHSAPGKPDWVDAHVEDLKKIEWEELLKYDESVTSNIDHVPVLRACCILEALSSVSAAMLSKGALGSYYYLLHELNFTAAPSGFLGGASAGTPDVRQTAFVTWWCVRALQGFAAALENAAMFLRTLAYLPDGESKEGIPELWWDEHIRGTDTSTAVTLESFRHVFLVDLSETESPFGPWQLRDNYFNDLKGNIQSELKAGEKTLDTLLEKRLTSNGGTSNGETPNGDGETPADPALRAARDFANQLAREHLANLREHVVSASKAAEAGNFSEIGVQLKQAADVVRNSLRQTEHYLQSVLESEIASDRVHPERVGDTAELVFAADGLGRLDPTAKDAMVAALRQATGTVTNEGRVPSHRPFDVLPRGYVLHVAAVEVIRVFADLVRRCDFEVSSDLAKRFFRHLRETWREEAKGWRHERDHEKANCQWWLSALAIEALRSLIRMINHRINQIILEQLTVRRPDQIKHDLAGLFYPDIGLRQANIRTQSLCVDLQRMRAHISGVSCLEGGPLHSIIFHGPPGTGKNTMAEALAKSSGVPLVEVTPSDIVMGGTELAETRARVVFEALSMLTNVVILLDEFDSILWHRDDEAQPENILQFLTPGMLPRLKVLNENAKKRGVAIILSTNLIGALDEAATREGRFDEKVGVFAPDALSRFGRLAYQLQVAEVQKKDGWTTRLMKVVERTGGVAISHLAKPGWFTGPVDGMIMEHTPFGYIVAELRQPRKWPGAGKGVPREPTVRPKKNGEQQNDEKNIAWDKSTKTAIREWIEWKWVTWLDVEVAKGNDVEESIKKWQSFDLPANPWAEQQPAALKAWKEAFDEQDA